MPERSSSWPQKLKILVFIHKSVNAGTATPQAFSLSYLVWPNLDWEDQMLGIKTIWWFVSTAAF